MSAPHFWLSQYSILPSLTRNQKKFILFLSCDLMFT
jgi:hypothetical protein